MVNTRMLHMLQGVIGFKPQIFHLIEMNLTKYFRLKSITVQEHGKCPNFKRWKSWEFLEFYLILTVTTFSRLD